jgi:hypothetical protein
MLVHDVHVANEVEREAPITSNSLEHRTFFNAFVPLMGLQSSRLVCAVTAAVQSG